MIDIGPDFVTSICEVLRFHIYFNPLHTYFIILISSLILNQYSRMNFAKPGLTPLCVNVYVEYNEPQAILSGNISCLSPTVKWSGDYTCRIGLCLSICPSVTLSCLLHISWTLWKIFIKFASVSWYAEPITQPCRFRIKVTIEIHKFDFLSAPYIITPGRIFIKLYSNVHLDETVCRTWVSTMQTQGQGHSWRSTVWTIDFMFAQYLLPHNDLHYFSYNYFLWWEDVQNLCLSYTGSRSRSQFEPWTYCQA